MADTNAELNQRAILETNTAAVAGALTAEQAHRANEIRRSLAQKGPDATLTPLQELKDRRSKGSPAQAINEAIGALRGPDGRKIRAAGLPEEARFNDAIAASSLAEKAYAEMTPTEQADAQTMIVEMFMTPDVQRIFDIYPAGHVRDAAMAAAAKKFLEDPKFASFIQRALQEATSKMPAEFNQELLQRAIQTKELFDKKDAELVQVNIAVGLADNELDKFKVTPGSDGEKLENLSRDKDILERKDGNYRRELDRLEVQKMGADRALLAAQNASPHDPAAEAAAEAEVKQVDGDISATKKLRDTNNAQLTELKDLQTRKAQAEKALKDLLDKHEKLEKERDEANYNQSRARIEYESALNKRAVQEISFVNGVQGVFGEAALDYMIDEMTNADEAQKKILEEQKTRADSDFEKRALSALETRWDQTTKRNWRGRMVPEVNRDAVSRDFEVLMQGGPDQLMRNYFIGIEPRLASNPSRLSALISNKELMDKLQPQVLQTMLARRFTTGRITEAEARKIASTPWGEQLITQAVEKNENIRKQIEAARQQGVVSGDFGSWLRNRSGGEIAGLVVLLIAILGGAAATVLTAGIPGAITAAAGSGLGIGGMEAGRRVSA